MVRRARIIPEGLDANNWPKVRMWHWTDGNGAIHLSLEPPQSGQKAIVVAVPAPQDPEMLLALIGRATGAAKELTGLEDIAEVKRELHKRANDARDDDQAAKRQRLDEQWADDGYAPPKPALESGQSIRAVSGGAPGLGKRH